MIRTVCINFSLKKSKILNNGTAPVYLRLTVAGERVEFTLPDATLNLTGGIPTLQKMTGTNEEARVFNHYLKTLEQKVFEEHRVMLDAKVSVTAENLRDRLLGNTDVKRSKMLVPIFKEHNNRIKLNTSLDYLTGLTEIEFDANILARINDIASLSNEDREHVFKVVDALIRDAKDKK